MYTLYHLAIFWVFAISFHDWKKCSEKCWTPSEHFCMTKMFKRLSDHFLPFCWVYLIPTYVRQLPPLWQINPFLNMDSSPYSSVASPSPVSCLPSARSRQEVGDSTLPVQLFLTNNPCCLQAQAEAACLAALAVANLLGQSTWPPLCAA
jgi:hypothetical protein